MRHTDVLDSKIKQNELVKKFNTSNPLKNSKINTRLTTLATKTKLKSEKGKIWYFGINERFGALEKSLVLTLLRQRQNFAWVNIAMVIIFICLLMEKKSLSLKPIKVISTFELNFD